MDKYRKELAETAKKICTPGKGILAADESEGTVGKKFATINLENNEENRRLYREMLFTSEGIEKYISGVIMFEETCRHATKDGKPFIEYLKEKGIVSGIKVDKGVKIIPGTDGETATMGLDSLADMAKKHYDMGCRFAKWRAVLKIGNGQPTEQAIQENAWGLARYAAICQENGLVPIVEPEILVDGEHDIQTSQAVTEKVLKVVFKALCDNNIFFEGCLLKPNMVTPGTKNADRAKVSAQEIAARTVTALSRTVCPAMVGIMFLSGGQSEEEATLNLNAMNQITTIRRPWFLSFSYGRALQNSAIKAWQGKTENFAAGQKAFLARAENNSQAQLGKYQGSDDQAGKESLIEENYVY